VLDRRIRTLTIGLLLAACGAHRQETTAPASLPGPDLPDGIDDRPLAEWWIDNSGRVTFSQSAPATDLSLSVNLIDWVVKRDEAAWQRMAASVERAYSDPSITLHPAVVVADDAKEEARRYHEAARPLAARPRDERDPDAEARLYGKALLLDLTDADLYNHLAIGASLRSEFEHAIRFAKLAIAVDPSFLSAYQELAYAYKNAERYDDVIPVADRGLKVDGDLRTKALLLARKGQAYWMLANERAALDAFRGSRRLGGPAWAQSYLDGEQTLGEEYRDPSAQR